MRATIGEVRRIIREILHEKAEVIVYHASPQLSLRRINPRYSPKFKTEGVFVTSNLQSILNSWASWAARKPDKTRTGRTENTFDKIAIYTIRIPKDVFDASEEYHGKTYEEAVASGDANLGSWGWDVETFIPKHLMPDGYLTPSSIKVYDPIEFDDLDVRTRSWQTAGRDLGRGEPIPKTGKNPAKEKFAELEEKIISAALERGGSLAQPTDWPAGKADPQTHLGKLRATLASLAKKTRLTHEEEAELNRVVKDIEDTLRVGAKAIIPQRKPEPKSKYFDSLTGDLKKPHTYKRSPSQRRDDY